MTVHSNKYYQVSIIALLWLSMLGIFSESIISLSDANSKLILCNDSEEISHQFEEEEYDEEGKFLFVLSGNFSNYYFRNHLRQVNHIAFGEPCTCSKNIKKGRALCIENHMLKMDFIVV